MAAGDWNDYQFKDYSEYSTVTVTAAANAWRTATTASSSNYQGTYYNGEKPDIPNLWIKHADVVVFVCPRMQ